MSVLVNGQILPELPSGVVLVPPGAEYVLRFRNKNPERSVVNFKIDGERVSGNGYVIPAHDYVDIKRHHHKDVAFKFVAADSLEAQDFGKNGPDDGRKGVIEAEFQLERKVVYKSVVNTVWPSLINPYMGQSSASFSIPSEIKLDFNNIPTSINCSLPNSFETYSSYSNQSLGCTVEGSQSGQSFSMTHIDLMPEITTLRLTLRCQVEQAVTSYCTNCGSKKGRKTDKFCGHCGGKF